MKQCAILYANYLFNRHTTYIGNICEINSKVEADPQTKNDHQTDQDITNINKQKKETDFYFFIFSF